MTLPARNEVCMPVRVGKTYVLHFARVDHPVVTARVPGSMKKLTKYCPTRLALVRLLVAAVAAAALFGGAGLAAADEHVRIISSGAESKFPENIRFFAEVESDVPIDDIRVRYTIGARATTQYNYLDLPKDAGQLVSGEYVHRISNSQSYIPPGAFITFNFEIYDEAGGVFESESQDLLVLDSRFEWEFAQTGPIIVYYHGPVKSQAQTLADKGFESLSIMGPITGSEIETPIVITMYNNQNEMFEAVVQRSFTTAHQLITEGQAFSSENVVIVQGGDTRAIGTATHELVHVLVHRATRGGATVPVWLNEGLAEFGNLDKSLSYDRYLEWAIDTGRLTPLHQLQSFPGDPNLVIVGYGQARNLVEFMIREWGPEKMADLLAGMADGQNVDRALIQTYGFGIRDLDHHWRESIDADPFVEPTPRPAPTLSPLARPTLTPYSLTPIAGGAELAVEASPTPTPIPETPTPAPTTAPEPTPKLTPVEGGRCNSPPQAGAGFEGSMVGGLAALLAFAVYKGTRRRRTGATGKTD